MMKNRMMKKLAVVSLLGAGVIGLTACNITPNGQVTYGNDGGYSVTYTNPVPDPATPAIDTPVYDPNPTINCGINAFGDWACGE